MERKHQFFIPGFNAAPLFVQLRMLHPHKHKQTGASAALLCRRRLTSLRREAQQVCLTFHTTAATSSSDRKQLVRQEQQSTQNQCRLCSKRLDVRLKETIKSTSYEGKQMYKACAKKSTLFSFLAISRAAPFFSSCL